MYWVRSAGLKRLTSLIRSLFNKRYDIQVLVKPINIRKCFQTGVIEGYTYNMKNLFNRDCVPRALYRSVKYFKHAWIIDGQKSSHLI